VGPICPNLNFGCTHNYLMLITNNYSQSNSNDERNKELVYMRDFSKSIVQLSPNNFKDNSYLHHF
jgi:hypothetical protein